MIIEALDGGNPPLKDYLLVNITILDINDNEPIFSQSRYYASLLENATVGSPVLQVTASDADEGSNGRIEYSLPVKLSNELPYFTINKDTGWIYLSKPIDFEVKSLHELSVVAKDCGVQPLETSAFVSIRVMDVNDNHPSIDVDLLTETGLPQIPENAKVGDKVARIFVNDADSAPLIRIDEDGRTVSPSLEVTLLGGEGSFALDQSDSNTFLLSIISPLNRRVQPKYSLTVVVIDYGNPPLNTSATLEVDIMATREASARTAKLLNWAFSLIIFILIITILFFASVFVFRFHQNHQIRHPSHQHIISSHNICQAFPRVGTLLKEMRANRSAIDSINGSTYGPASLRGLHHHLSSHHNQFLVGATMSTVAPCYDGVLPRVPHVLINNGTVINNEGHSASSGRGSAEYEEVEGKCDEVDEEVRMINESGNFYAYHNAGHVPDEHELIPTVSEYLEHLEAQHQLGPDDADVGEDVQSSSESALREAKLKSDFSSSVRRLGRTSLRNISESREAPEMPRSTKELAGAYNWDYLRDWMPEYQPLSSICTEVGRLKGSSRENSVHGLGDGSTASRLEEMETRSQTSNARLSLRSHSICGSQKSNRLRGGSVNYSTKSAFQPFNPASSREQFARASTTNSAHSNDLPSCMCHNHSSSNPHAIGEP